MVLQRKFQSNRVSQQWWIDFPVELQVERDFSDQKAFRMTVILPSMSSAKEHRILKIKSHRVD